MVFLPIFPDVAFQELDEWVGNLDLGSENSSCWVAFNGM